MDFDIGKILSDVAGPTAIGITLVYIFLRYLTKLNDSYQSERKARDKQWQDFFTMLNAGNKEDTKALTDAMTKLTNAVTDSFHSIARDIADHDKRVDERINASQNIVTQPRRLKTPKGGNQ